MQEGEVKVLYNTACTPDILSSYKVGKQSLYLKDTT